MFKQEILFFVRIQAKNIDAELKQTDYFKIVSLFQLSRVVNWSSACSARPPAYLSPIRLKSSLEQRTDCR